MDFMPARTLRALIVVCGTFLIFNCTPVHAQTAAPTVTASAPAKIDTGDTAWMLVSAALVLMMTGPGLALFYSGLVRRKNVLATMMQSFILMAVVTVIWAIIGY